MRRCPQNIGTNISTTTATVAALGRFDRKGYKGEGVGRDQGFVGSGLLNEPTSSGDAHVGAQACEPL